MRAATSQTRESTFAAAHTMEIALAMRASVQISPGALADRERKIVTALLVPDSQVPARLLPLGTMREDGAPTRPKLSENMRQFMAQSALGFTGMLKQPRIQQDEFLAIISAASGCFET